MTMVKNKKSKKSSTGKTYTFKVARLTKFLKGRKDSSEMIAKAKKVGVKKALGAATYKKYHAFNLSEAKSKTKLRMRKLSSQKNLYDFLLSLKPKKSPDQMESIIYKSRTIGAKKSLGEALYKKYQAFNLSKARERK